MEMSVSIAKRIFDIVLCLITVWLWGPIVIICALLNLLVNGRPAFYLSERRVYNHSCARITKFRAMVRHADKIANRDTMPISDKIFLNIPADSPLYTPLGRLFERLCFTELPQLLHVLAGQMSLVGNRPLPENVVAKLRSRYPYAEDRFLVRAGMTGPVQLIGRDNLPDDKRLSLEIRYCKACLESYSVRLDFMILLYTVLIGIGISSTFSVYQVEQLLDRYCRYNLAGWWNAYLEHQHELIEVLTAKVTAEVPAKDIRLSSRRREALWRSEAVEARGPGHVPKGQIKLVETSMHRRKDQISKKAVIAKVS